MTKKYKGALKLTSGQRILITNFQIEDIPQIWEELDMEPTVKQQNSVKNFEMCPAGFYPRQADVLTKGLQEKEVLKAVESLVELYCEQAEMGEKLGNFIDRVGVEYVRSMIRFVDENQK